MRGLLGVPQIPRRGIQVARHDIPPQAPAREVVDGAQAARQVVRLLVRRRDRHAEAQVRRRRRHGGHDGQRLVDGPLCAGDHGGVWVARAFVYVVWTLFGGVEVLVSDVYMLKTAFLSVSSRGGTLLVHNHGGELESRRHLNSQGHRL